MEDVGTGTDYHVQAKKKITIFIHKKFEVILVWCLDLILQL